MLYRPDRGWGIQHGTAEASNANSARLDDLLRRVLELEARAKHAEPPAKSERIETRAKHPDLAASTSLEATVKRGAK
jgi:hypothetical protein